MIKFAHFFLAIIIMAASCIHIPEQPLLGIYDLLLVVVNMLLAMFWQREE